MKLQIICQVCETPFDSITRMNEKIREKIEQKERIKKCGLKKARLSSADYIYATYMDF